MSYNHGQFGWEKFDEFVHLLRLARVTCQITEGGCDPFGCTDFYDGSIHDGISRQLRTARFTTPHGVQMVIEEYCQHRDNESDGDDQFGVAVYEEGHRPKLVTRLTEFDRETGRDVEISQVWY